MPFERACHLQENRAKFPMSHAGTRCKTRLPQPARVRPASPGPCGVALRRRKTDRKSTRLNSSHLVISYAVFCLKKKKHTATPSSQPTSTLYTLARLPLLRLPYPHLYPHPSYYLLSTSARVFVNLITHVLTRSHL